MKIKTFGAAVFLFSVTAGVSFANTFMKCEDDVQQMYREIQRWGSITSPVDHSSFTDVRNPNFKEEKQLCFAEGYYVSFVCNISWEKGNWGDTFRCS